MAGNKPAQHVRAGRCSELSGISLGNLCHRRMINDDPVGIMTPLPMFRHDEKQRSQDEEMQQRFPQQPRAPTPLHSFRTGIDAQTQWAVVSSMLRSEEHTSELQSLMRISYAVFCLKKKTQRTHYRLTYASSS